MDLTIPSDRFSLIADAHAPKDTCDVEIAGAGDNDVEPHVIDAGTEPKARRQVPKAVRASTLQRK